MAENKGNHQPVEREAPSAIDVERLILGCILLNNANWDPISSSLAPGDFFLEAHKRLFSRMLDLHEKGEKIDRITVHQELTRHGQLESMPGGLGLSYIVSLDESLPEIPNVDSYVRIVKEKSNLRQLIAAAQRTIDAASVGLAPAQEIANSAAEALQGIQVGTDTEQCGRTPESIVTNFPGGIGAFLNPASRQSGLKTGFRRLDEVLGGGLQKGELIILAARPGVGKSACMLNMAQHITMDPHNPQRVDIFSLEMSGEALITRLLCGEARVSSGKFRTGFLNADERSVLQKSLHKILEAPLRIHDEFKRTLPGLVGRIRRAVKEGSALVAIDFVQLLTTGSKSENRNLEIGEIGRALKLLTLDLQIPILLLSQIGRAADKRPGTGRPQLSDLKDSGTLEEHADTVMTIFREEMLKKDRTDLQGLADIDILKQRNGECGRVALRFIGQFVTFVDRTEGTSFPEENSPAPEPPPYAPTGADGW